MGIFLVYFQAVQWCSQMVLSLVNFKGDVKVENNKGRIHWVVLLQISNVSDEHVAKLGKKYSVGKKVRARVVGFRVMDGLAIASLKVGIFVFSAVGFF